MTAPIATDEQIRILEHTISDPSVADFSVGETIVSALIARIRLLEAAQTAPAEVVAYEHFDNKGSKELSYHPATEYMQRIGYQSRGLVYTTPTQAEAREAGIRAEAEFLLERLEEFERDMAEDDEHEFYGHVAPSIARLRALLKEGEAR